MHFLEKKISPVSDSSIPTRRSRSALSVCQGHSAVSDQSLFVQTSHLFVFNKRIMCLAVWM